MSLGDAHRTGTSVLYNANTNGTQMPSTPLVKTHWTRKKSVKLNLNFKGTGSPDGLGFSWHIWIDLGLKKGRGWFLNFLGAPSIIHWNTRISCGKCDCELAYKVSCLFLSVPANHKPSILSNDKSGLAYCWCLTMRVGALPANPPSQWETRAGGWRNLSNPADQ
jgi:hypothetical protein